VELRTINTFLHIAELHSFSRAARELGYSQSAVSAQVAQLETELETPLFDRVGKTVRLTDAGQTFLTYARSLLATAEQAKAALQPARQVSGTLRVALADSVCSTFLPDLLQRYHALCPQVELVLRTATDDEMLQMLGSNQIDLAYTLDKPLLQPSFVLAVDEPEPICVVAPAGHPLAGQAEVTLQELAGQAFASLSVLLVEHAVHPERRTPGLPALTAPDLADMIRYGKMPQMNMASGCEYNYPEFQDYIRKADVVSVQIGSNDAFVPCIVALGNATNWKSEKLAATILAGDLRNEGSGSTMSAIYRSIKAMNLTKAERDATWNLLFSGMSKICDETYPKTTAALISIVQEIRNLNPDAQIILVGYTNPVPLIPCWRSYFNKLNKFEKQIAKTYNLTYVAIPNTETTLDVHPTIKGHQYIANKLVNAIENP